MPNRGRQAINNAGHNTGNHIRERRTNTAIDNRAHLNTQRLTKPHAGQKDELTARPRVTDAAWWARLPARYARYADRMVKGMSKSFSVSAVRRIRTATSEGMRKGSWT